MLIRTEGGILTDFGWSAVFIDGGDGVGVRHPGNLTTGRALTIFFLQHFQSTAQLGLILASSNTSPGATSAASTSATSTAPTTASSVAISATSAASWRCLTTASGRAGGGSGSGGPDARSASGPGLFATHGGSGARLFPAHGGASAGGCG